MGTCEKYGIIDLKGGVYMAYVGYNDAKKKANAKYLRKQAEIRIRMTPEDKKAIEDKAREENKSVNQYVKDRIL